MFFISECGCNSYGFGICNKANISNSSSEIYNKKSESNSICNLFVWQQVNDIDKQSYYGVSVWIFESCFCQLYILSSVCNICGRNHLINRNLAKPSYAFLSSIYGPISHVPFFLTPDGRDPFIITLIKTNEKTRSNFSLAET